jgi:hypothetical protein
MKAPEEGPGRLYGVELHAIVAPVLRRHGSRLSCVAVMVAIVALPSPTGPVWIRVILEAVWIIWTGALLVRSPRSPRPA